MGLPIRAALRSASRFVMKNPTTLIQMAKHAVSLKVAVPLDAIRWFIVNTPPGRKGPQDVTIHATPPAISVGATIDLMDTPIRAGATIYVEELRIEPDELRLSLRLADVTMRVIGESQTPVAGLIKSGALDLSKPGNLANFMPKRPPVLVEAKDDRIVLDLMKNPKIARNIRLNRILSTLTPVMNVQVLETDRDFLIIGLKATPFGFPRALNAARSLTA